MQPNMKAFVILCIVLVAMGFAMGFLVAYLEFRGPLGDGEAERAENANTIRKDMNAAKLSSHLSDLTMQPNTAGTSTGAANAEQLRAYFESQGLDVRVDSYDVLLSFPDRSVSTNQAVMLDGNKEVLRRMPETSAAVLRLAREAGDDVTNKTKKDEQRLDDAAYPYIAYSASGTVEGDVTYANYAEEEDFEWLGSAKVNGKIILARYGRNTIAEKVELAIDNGASAVLLFADPMEFAQNNVTYPDTWWLPSDAAHWGTAYTGGDPLTPYVPATGDAERQLEEDADLPTIPVHSLSYGDAEVLLRVMKDPVAPDDWQGGLRTTYKVGPGFSNPGWKVKVEVVMENVRTSISNVIGVIEGDTEPDRYVMIGGGIDSWGTGGVGASGATAVLMEVARTLGKLKEAGWVPRRTIMLCGWDAMEFGDIGLTEWLQEHTDILSGRVVAYLDIDTPVEGTYAPYLSASDIIAATLKEASKEVSNPCEKEENAGRKYVYDTLEFKGELESEDTDRSVGALIREYLGAATAEIRYTYDSDLNIPHHPLYHTRYDTYETFRTLIDPGFKYHLAVSQWVGGAALQLADRPLLAYDISKFGEILDEHADALTSGIQDLDNAFQLETAEDLDEYKKAVDKFQDKLPEFQDRTKGSDPTKPLVMRQINDQLLVLVKTFSKPVPGDVSPPFDVDTVSEYIRPLNGTKGRGDMPGTAAADLANYIGLLAERLELTTDKLRKPTEF